MLYATTRGKHDVVTAYKATHTDCYTDGGLFVPFKIPNFHKEQLEAMMELPSTQIIAEILNLFFSCGLTSWDVELALGRKPVKAAALGRRLLVAELWRSSGIDVNLAVQRLSDRIRGGQKGQTPTNWMHIAVRIALLFASYAGLMSAGVVRLQRLSDVAVTTGDFAMPMAAWYARQMGLPIGNIICGCNHNGGFWDLLNRGEFSTGDILTHTVTPDADVVVPRNLERLIYATLGVDEAQRYLQICSRGRTYTLAEDDLQKLSHAFYTAVISDSRVGSIISGVYRTRDYVLSPYAALAYGSLQDYRAMTGHTRPCLLLAEYSPMRDRQLVCNLLQMSENDLSGLVGR